MKTKVNEPVPLFQDSNCFDLEKIWQYGFPYFLQPQLNTKETQFPPATLATDGARSGNRLLWAGFVEMGIPLVGGTRRGTPDYFLPSPTPLQLGVIAASPPISFPERSHPSIE